MQQHSIQRARTNSMLTTFTKSTKKVLRIVKKFMLGASSIIVILKSARYWEDSRLFLITIFFPKVWFIVCEYRTKIFIKNKKLLYFAETQQYTSDENITFLKQNCESFDPDIDIRNLWVETFKLRNNLLLENKKLDKKEHYLSFRCLDSIYGLSLVNFLLSI